MVKVYQTHCPKCNNNHSFYRYGKDKSGFRKYLCRKCGHQFAPDAPSGKPGSHANGHILPALFAGKLSSCTTIWNITPITVAATNAATTLFACLSQLSSSRRLSQNQL